jgi:hypothetical protein
MIGMDMGAEREMYEESAAPPAQAAQSADPAAGLPILYRRPVAVTPDRFAGRSFVRAADYGYARGAHLVPINALQIVDAAASFPVIFSAEAPFMTIAVLGLRAGENLFVEADGRWADGHPVPDYIRRYPFILKHSGQAHGFSLCIDDASPMVVDGDAQPFYEDGAHSAMIEQVLQSCLAYQRQSEVTHAFAATIADSGILVPHGDIETGPGGAKVKLDGFRMIDKKKFDALPDATVLEWRRNGYLDFVYLHLVSLRTWPRLIHRFIRRSRG